MAAERRNKTNLRAVARGGLPVGLLVATACRGPDETADTVLSDKSSMPDFSAQTQHANATISANGNAIKGPLENAITFFDFNDDGLLNEFRIINFDQNGLQTGYTAQLEPQARTDTFGAYEIYTNIDPNADVLLQDGSVQKASSARIATLTDNNTIDRSSDQELPGVLLTAPAGSTVITPLTTLMDFANLSSDELKLILNLDNDLPPLNTFNHYTDQAHASAGVQIENFSQQFIATVTAYSGLLELSGLDANTAYQTTVSALAEMAIEKSEGGSTMVLSNPQELDTLFQKVSQKLDILSPTNKSSFVENVQELNEELLELNLDIETVENLFTNEAKEQYSRAANLNELVKQTIIKNAETFDFSTPTQTFSGEPLGIGAKIPVSSIAGESGKKVTAPFIIYLDSNEKALVWSYFNQSSVKDTELVMTIIDQTPVTSVFSKPGQSQFDAEGIILANGMMINVTSHVSENGNDIQVSLVLMKQDQSDGNFQQFDEFKIFNEMNEQNLNATLLEVGPNQFAVAWTSYTPNESEHDIYAQIFSVDEETNQIVPEKVELRVNKFSDGNQTNVSLGQLDDHTFSATWVSERFVENDHGYNASNGTEIYATEFTKYGSEKQVSETLTLIIYEDAYNNLQISSNFQVGSITGSFMLYPVEGIFSTSDITTSTFEIKVNVGANGTVEPILYDASATINQSEILDKYGENPDLKYKILSLEESWSSLDETWLQMDANTGLITGQPSLSKIGYNEVAGLLYYPILTNGSLVEFDVRSTDSMLTALSKETVFNDEQFTDGFNISQQTLDPYTTEIIKEAVVSQNFRDELKQNFNKILNAFDEHGALIPTTLDPATALRVERHVDDFGVLRLESFDGAVLIGTELISLPEILDEGANALQGLYGTMLIDPNTGTYEYSLDGVEARKAIQASPNGQIMETFDVRYATENLISAGVGGINFNPESISLDDGTIYTLWLIKFPVQDTGTVTNYKPYLPYAAGTQVKYSPDLFNQSLDVKASLTDSSAHELKLSIIGSGSDIKLQLGVNDELYQAPMISVDGTRVENPIIEFAENGVGSTANYPGNYQYRATGQIDLNSLGGNIGWLTKAGSTNLFSQYGEFIFDPVSGKYDFKLKWGTDFEFQSAAEVYEYFVQSSPAVIEETFDLKVGTIEIEVVSDEKTLLTSSENSYFDGLILPQDTIQDRGEDLLRLEYDVLSLYSDANFDPDAPLDFEVQSQSFLDTVSSNPSLALTEYETLGDYGSLLIDKNTGEYFYNLNTNIIKSEMESGQVTWDYDLAMEELFSGDELLDTFHLSISNANKAVYTSLKEVPISTVPEIGTNFWIENTEQTQLMLSAQDAAGLFVIEPMVVDDDFGFFTNDFDAELVNDSHILLAWTKANNNENSRISSSYFDINANSSDLLFEFNSNEFEVSQIAKHGQSNPKIASGPDGDFTIVWEAHPFLTAQDMENMDLVYSLYDIDALDVRATSYYEPEPDDNIIEDFDEFIRYLDDTKIFDVPLDKKIAQLDQTKVQDHLELLGDYIYYIEYGTDFYGLPDIS